MEGLDQAPSVKQVAFLWRDTIRALNKLRTLLDTASPITPNLTRALVELPVARQYSYVDGLYNRMRPHSATGIDAEAFASQLSAADSALRSAKEKFRAAEESLSRLHRVRSSRQEPYGTDALSTMKMSIASAEQALPQLDYSALLNAQRDSEATARLAEEVASRAEAIRARANAEDADIRYRENMRGNAKMFSAIPYLAVWLFPGVSAAAQGGVCYDVGPLAWIPAINWLVLFMASVDCRNFTFGNFALAVIATIAFCVVFGWAHGRAEDAANKR